jgi:hypothetical protein
MNEEKIIALRQQDANLREAIRQDEMELPKMPAELNAKLMQRMGAQPQKSRIRRLWPWLAAACVAAFIVVLIAPPEKSPTGEPKVTAKTEQPATVEIQEIEPQAEAPNAVDTQKTIVAPVKSPRHKTAKPAVTEKTENLLAQESAPVEEKTAETPVQETSELATTATPRSQSQTTTLTERDIPITRPENYKYTPEELALMKKQANEAYLKWVELELEIARHNLEQTAQQ